MAPITTAELTMPRDVADGMIKQAANAAVVAQLGNKQPFRFGATDFTTITGKPKAEFIGEGQAKSGASVSFGTFAAKTRKAQVTLRVNDEVRWADEDYRLGILEELGDLASEAIAEAIDYSILHGINPATGAALSGSPATVASAPLVVAAAGAADLEIENAVGALIAAGASPNAVALTPLLAHQLCTKRDPNGRKLYSEVPLAPGPLGSFDGLSAVVSQLVAAPDAASAGAKKIVGIVGDWSAIRWGVVRELPIELIEFGDPDGDGDLKRKNQFALRMEILLAWHVDSTKFALIKES